MTRTAAIAIAALIAMSAGARADVRVNFVNPERFSDEDFRTSSKRAGILEEFEKYFDRLGELYLREGQSLKLDVLNIELAGRYEPWQRQFHDVRILGDITPPRFKVRYTLREGGKVLVSGEENVVDRTYQWNASARSSNRRFAYEKDMMRDWFLSRFVKLRPSRN